MKQQINDAKIIETKINNMPDFELSRWLALVDAVNMVADMAKEKNIDFGALDIKPSAIEHYIESTCDIYCKKIQEENVKQKQKTALTMATNIIKQINTPDLTLCHN